MAKDRRLLLFLESPGLDPKNVFPVVIHKNPAGKRAAANIQFFLLDEHNNENVLPASDGSADPYEVKAENGYWRSPGPWNLEDYKQHGYRTLRIKSAGCDSYDVNLDRLTEPKPNTGAPNAATNTGTASDPIPDHVSEPAITKNSGKPTERVVTFVVQNKDNHPCADAEVIITRNGTPLPQQSGPSGACADIFDIPLGETWSYAITVVRSGKVKYLQIVGDPLPKGSGIPAPLVASKINFVNSFPVPGAAGTHTVTVDVVTDAGELVADTPFEVLVEGQPGQTERSNASGTASFSVAIATTGKRKLMFRIPGKALSAPLELEGAPVPTPTPPPPSATKAVLVTHHPKVGSPGTHTVHLDLTDDGDTLIPSAVCQVIIENVGVQTETADASGSVTCEIAIPNPGTTQIHVRVPGKPVTASFMLDGPPAATPAASAPEAEKVLVISHHANPAAASGTTSYIVVAETQGADDKPVPNAPYQLIVQGQPPKIGTSDAQGCVTETVTFNTQGTFSVQFRIPGHALTAPISLDGPPAPTPAPPPPAGPDMSGNWKISVTGPGYPIERAVDTATYRRTISVTKEGTLATGIVSADFSTPVTVIGPGGVALCTNDYSFSCTVVGGSMGVSVKSDANEFTGEFQAGSARETSRFLK